MASTTAIFSIRFMFVILLTGVGINAQPLSPTFYRSSCPNLLSIIRTAVTNATIADPRMGASLLRMHFHDCFVNGCDAGVLLDDIGTFRGEKTAGPNANSLRGFEVIDNIKSLVERACPRTVSCADILTIAARDGVVVLRGPSWPLALGRRDSTTANFAAANTQIPGPFSDLSTLITSFNRKGFNPNEMVALSGSHTIGQSRCTLFRNRLYNEPINASFAASLRRSCPRTGGDNNLSPLDSSPTVFNNDYFKNLVNLRGLLHSDQQLFNNGTTDAQVRTYISNPARFSADFASAMVKMSNLSPLTGARGQIRTNCRRIN